MDLMSITRRSLALAFTCALCFVSITTPSTSVKAAPSGAITTSEILVGAGAVAYFLKYEAALKHLRGSYDEAEATVSSPDIAKLAYSYIAAETCAGVTPGPDPSSYNCSSAIVAPRPFNLRNVRDQLIKAIHLHWHDTDNKKMPPPWRKHYEDYLGCYNHVMFALATPAPSPTAVSSSQSVATTPIPTAKPSSIAPAGAHGPNNHAPPNNGHHIGPKAPAADRARKNKVTPPKLQPSRDAMPAPLSSNSSASLKADDGDQLVIKSCNDLLADLSQPTLPQGSIHGKVPGASPVPSPTPTLNAQALYPIDELNLTQSLSTAPSLLQQLSDQNIGLHVADNAVRVAFLIRAGANLLNKIAPHSYPSITTPPGVGGAPIVVESDYTAVYSSCIASAPLNALNCLGSLSVLEQKVEASRQQKISCDWAKSIVLPSYTLLQTYDETRKAWGAPPGC